jgi:hypothetical protein
MLEYHAAKDVDPKLSTPNEGGIPHGYDTVAGRGGGEQYSGWILPSSRSLTRGATGLVKLLTS